MEKRICELSDSDRSDVVWNVGIEIITKAIGHLSINRSFRVLERDFFESAHQRSFLTPPHRKTLLINMTYLCLKSKKDFE